MGLRGWPCRALTATAIVVMTLSLSAAGTAQATSADDGLVVTSDTTFVVDPSQGAIRAETRYTLTNVMQDRWDGYGRREYFYFDSFTVGLPAEADNVTVTTTSGRPLYSSVSVEDDVALVEMSLGTRLLYQQTRTIIVSFELGSGEPRTEALVRVNPAYVFFPAWGFGDPGRVSIRVELPQGFEVETFGSELAELDGEEGVVLEARDIADPEGWLTLVTARSDDGLLSEPASTGDIDVLLRAWPDDPGWLSFASDQVVDGLPVLEELIGFGWPLDERLEIIESFTPYLYGYAGWFTPADGVIEVGEDLDQHVMLHELAHVWFNEQLVTGRWIGEGLADEYATRAAAELGAPLSGPEPIDYDSPHAVPLNSWREPEPGDEEAGAKEEWGYNASWWVLRQLGDEIGLESLSGVLAAMNDRSTPYVGDGPAEELFRAADWRRFLDLLEEHAGSERAEELFRAHVVDPGDSSRLDERAEARVAYGDLRERGDGWAVPLVIRSRMTQWRFAAAGELIEEADSLLSDRDDLAARAESADLDVPAMVESLYEEASRDLAAPAEALDEMSWSLDAVLGAIAEVQADRDLFTTVGLWFSDVAGELREARQAFSAGELDEAIIEAREVEDLMAGADEAGQVRVTVGASTLVTLVALGVVGLRRRRLRVARRGASPDRAFGSGPNEYRDFEQRDPLGAPRRPHTADDHGDTDRGW